MEENAKDSGTMETFPRRMYALSHRSLPVRHPERAKDLNEEEKERKERSHNT